MLLGSRPQHRSRCWCTALPAISCAEQQCVCPMVCVYPQKTPALTLLVLPCLCSRTHLPLHSNAGKQLNPKCLMLSSPGCFSLWGAAVSWYRTLFVEQPCPRTTNPQGNLVPTPHPLGNGPIPTSCVPSGRALSPHHIPSGTALSPQSTPREQLPPRTTSPFGEQPQTRVSIPHVP